MAMDKVVKMMVVLGIIALAGLAWAQMARLTQARDDARVAAGLVRDSLAAAADTTRVLHLRVEALGESLTVVQRRAVQAGQQGDALDRALGMERAARVQLATQVTAMSRTVRTDAVREETSPGERTAVFDVREAPYSVHADVRLPRPPASGTMAVRVALDTLGMDVRISCGSADESGVRPAMASVVAPAWATVRLRRVEQEPGVCARAPHHPATSLLAAARRWVSERAGVTVGLGVARDSHGVVVAGPGAMVGVRAWP